MISEKLDADVLGISCFDSDYLYLNLINKNENINVWASTGSAAGTGIRRRMGINAWKSKVKEFSRFKESLKTEYVFAEEQGAYLVGLATALQAQEDGLENPKFFIFTNDPEWFGKNFEMEYPFRYVDVKEKNSNKSLYNKTYEILNKDEQISSYEDVTINEKIKIN